MGKHTDQRNRTLTLARILQEETDERHPLTLAQIMERLGREEIVAERKSIYRDLAALRRHGLDVVFRPGGDGGWYIEHRTFDLEELRGVIDAVSVYRGLPEDRREELVAKLSAMASLHQRKGLRRPVSLPPQKNGDAEELRGVLDKIHAAIQGKKALTFVPFAYDKGKSKVFGPRQALSPKGLLWSGEVYHLLAWDHRAKSLRLFRTDRMAELMNTGLPAQGPEADPCLWASAPFGLDPNRRERVRLRCCQELSGEVLDRFGAEVPLIPEGEYFTLTADVVVGPEFWGWAAAHSSRLDVVAPPWAAKLWSDRYQMKDVLPARRPQAV